MDAAAEHLRGGRNDVTGLLNALGGAGVLGSSQSGAIDQIMPAIYADLHRLADEALRQERTGHTLQATALVHEAFLRLVDQRNVNWRNRAHFFAAAAQAIRRILVDHARARNCQKRCGLRQQVDLSDEAVLPSARGPRGQDMDILALDDALKTLAEEEPLEASIVEMRFFAGLDFIEIAEVLGVTERTVGRHWAFAKAWLFRRLRTDPTRGEPR